MALVWQRLQEASQALAPEGSAKRKIAQIVAVVFFFQGISIVLLSSHFGPILGVLSIMIGVLVLVIYPPRLRFEEQTDADQARRTETDTYGIRLIDSIFRKAGGAYVAVAFGAAVIIGVLLYNRYVSSRSDIGDLDLLSMIMGGLIISYPFVNRRFRIEISFALLFIAFVTVILVIPQAVLSFGEGTSAGNWYVHYMLAAPFAYALSLLGIDASAQAEVVTITFNDGSIHMLGISAACAGLYSFSIFVSAFFSFVLVFERLPLRVTTLVMALGLLIAYLGNLFRMVVIGVIGYYNGMDALLWAHDNVGWIVFLAWSSIFWYAVIRYSDRRKLASDTSQQTNLDPPDSESLP